MCTLLCSGNCCRTSNKFYISKIEVDSKYNEMATIFGRTQSFRPGMHETVLDAFIPASDVPTPRLVSEKAHPNNYTVVTEDSGPKIHVDFIEYTSFYVFHAGKFCLCLCKQFFSLYFYLPSPIYF